MTAELVGGAGLPVGPFRVVVGGASGGVAGTSSITMSAMEKKEGGVLKGGEDVLLHELFCICCCILALSHGG